MEAVDGASMMTDEQAEAAKPERGAKSTDRSGQVQSLVRALRLLSLVSEAEEGASLTELSNKAGLAPSTSHRLLSTLQQEGFVRFDQERTRWLVGVNAFIAGAAFMRTRDLSRIARPHMRHLMEETGETVNLAIHDRGECVYVSQVECRQMMRALASPGARVPMHASAVGKALLAAMEPAEVEAILARHGMPRITARTIASPQALAQELEQVRRLGYAVDDEEHAQGLRCAAALVWDENGEPAAALSLSGPLVRISSPRLAELGRQVGLAARKVTASYGGSAGSF